MDLPAWGHSGRCGDAPSREAYSCPVSPTKSIRARGCERRPKGHPSQPASSASSFLLLLLPLLLLHLLLLLMLSLLLLLLFALRIHVAVPVVPESVRS